MFHLTDEQLALLMLPLHKSRVESRTIGGGSQASYLKGWDVRAMLIRVFGFGGFSVEVVDSKVLSTTINMVERTKRKDGQQVTFEVPEHTVLASATVRLTVWDNDRCANAVYTEVAASSQNGTQGIGEVTDFALKTAETDGLKRGATNLGTQFGLGLYDNGSFAEVVRSIYAPDQLWGKPKEGSVETPVIATSPEAETGTAANPAKTPAQTAAAIKRATEGRQRDAQIAEEQGLLATDTR